MRPWRTGAGEAGHGGGIAAGERLDQSWRARTPAGGNGVVWRSVEWPVFRKLIVDLVPSRGPFFRAMSWSLKFPNL